MVVLSTLVQNLMINSDTYQFLYLYMDLFRDEYINKGS